MLKGLSEKSLDDEMCVEMIFVAEVSLNNL